MKSILDLLNRWAGKHRISPGTSDRTLINPSDSHEDDDEIAETNATSGEKEARATVRVRQAVHVAAKTITGQRSVRRVRTEAKNEESMIIDAVWVLGEDWCQLSSVHEDPRVFIKVESGRGPNFNDLVNFGV